MIHITSERELYVLKIIEMIQNFNETERDKMIMIGVLTTTMIQTLYSDPEEQMEMAQLMAKGLVEAMHDIQKENSDD